MNYTLKKFCLGWIGLLSSVVLCGQISGHIQDETGEPLAFASIYISGTTSGTITNADGAYILTPSEVGTMLIICQYLGYESQTKEINYQGNEIQLDFVLKTESITAPTIEISANAEDPAYPIIRRAIAKRSVHEKNIQSLSYETYIKGIIQLHSLSDFLMNRLNEDPEYYGLNKDGQGIVYLSESQSTYYKDGPAHVKEIMHRSIVSGYDSELSFNNALSMDFSIYDKSMEITRSVLSPIAPTAFSMYRYKLLGSTLDESGRLLYKIEVIPKSTSTPTFGGILYVLQDKWSIPKASLYTTGARLQTPEIDTFNFDFTALEVAEDTWVDIHKNISMQLKFLGIKATGGFNGVFSDYTINPTYDRNFFKQDLLIVKKDTNALNIQYWDSIRPIPLGSLETENYIVMDSIKVIRKQRADSLMRNQSSMQLVDIFTGYDRYTRNGKLYSKYEGVLSDVMFDAVSGLSFGTGWSIRTNPDSLLKSKWSAGFGLNYGISEERLRGHVSFEYKKSKRRDTWSFAAGRYRLHFNQDLPLYPIANALYSLIDAQNLARYYEKDAVSLSWNKSLKSGIDIHTFGEFGRRRPLINHTDYHWAGSNAHYLTNEPMILESQRLFEKNSHVIIGFSFDYAFNQQYITYPNREFKVTSPYPRLGLDFLVDHNLTNNLTFSRIQFRARDDYGWGLLGEGDWRMNVGTTIHRDELLYDTDLKHFDGNQTNFIHGNDFYSSYLLLPYYAYSTSGSYIECHVGHNFNGFILDRIPLIKKLKWQTIVGANYLYTEELGHYTELHVGLDNIGIHLFRPLSISYAWSFIGDEFVSHDFIIGIDIGKSRSEIRAKNGRPRTYF